MTRRAASTPEEPPATRRRGDPPPARRASDEDEDVEMAAASSSSSAPPPRRIEEMELTIEGPSLTFKLTVSPFQNIDDLRAKVAAKCSAPTDELVMKTSDGRVLANGKTLEFYDLPEKSRIVATKKKEKAAEGESDLDDAIASLAHLKGKCRGVDVCFAFDTTGSMNSVIQEVRKQVRATCQRLMEDIKGIRISIMGVGDYCDQMSAYVVHTLDFCDKPKDIETFVAGVGGTFGGDSPECYEWALHKANRLSWRSEPGIAKAFVLIADATPHPPSFTTAHCSWQDELATLADSGVKVYAVQATPCERYTPFYARMAERSGGLHLTFKSFDLITKMFLAVCYREAGRLDEYQAEGRKGARGQEMGEILDAMAKPNEKLAEESKVVCSEHWFTETVEQAKGRSPSYFYDPTRDMFFSWNGNYGEDVDTDKFSKGMDDAIDEQFRLRKWADLCGPKESRGKVVSFTSGRPATKKTPTPKRTPKRTPKKAAPSTTPRTPKATGPTKAKTPPPSSSSSSSSPSSSRKRKRVVSEETVTPSKRRTRSEKEEVKSEREERAERREIERESPKKATRTYYWQY